MLNPSGLLGPLLRSLFTRENQELKFQFILVKAKRCPGNSVSYYYARKKSVSAALKAWKQMPKASALPKFVKMDKFDNF